MTTRDPTRLAEPSGPGGVSAFAARLRDIHKHFGATVANRGASLTLGAREIHAVVGENGAGKSTLAKILAGLIHPDRGKIEIDGSPVPRRYDAHAAIGLGIGMVHQHFLLAGNLTVVENIILGREPRRGPWIDMGRAIREIEALGDAHGLRVDPRRRAGDLSVGEAQRVELVKLLYRGARLLVLDEPTAVLSPPEVAELWRVLRSLRDEGATIVVITHKLQEVMEVSERVTVLRAGESIAELRTRDTTPDELARAMVGRDLAPLEIPSPTSPSAEAVLDLHDLAVEGPRGRRAVSLRVHAGEIVGVAGVEGNGQNELEETIAGWRPARGGRMTLGGRDLTLARARARKQAGLAHIPADRQTRGLVLDFTVGENLILGRQREFSRLGWLRVGAVKKHAADCLAAFDVRPPRADVLARTLSGGNQQKIVVARELTRDYSFLLACQPTRGVDIGAIERIHSEILRARAAGKAILLVSSELSEVLALSDRVLVLFDGRIAGELTRKEAMTPEGFARLGQLMAGLAPNSTRDGADDR